ncbi:MAG: helix-turn-helix transcriptional regulator [Pseudomonadota bacterium]
MDTLPMEWGVRAAQSATVGHAWADFSFALNQKGFDSFCFLYEWELFNFDFPGSEFLYGNMISENFEDFCRSPVGSETCETSFRVAEASSYGRECYLDTESILTNEELDVRQIGMVEAMRNHGMQTGWTLPLVNRQSRKYSALLIDSELEHSAFGDLVKVNSSWVRQSFVYFCEGLGVLGLLSEDGKPTLSQRELDCLAWVAAGKSTKEIATSLNLAEATVNEYLASATRKLSANNRVQAAARSVLLGLNSV